MAAPRTTAISIAEMAQEKLEKFQIRRENQALLERISSIGSQREKDLEEIRQKYEAALETNKETLAKIEELERKVAERDREVDEFIEDLQRFKGTVEEFLRTRASDGWFRSGSRDADQADKNRRNRRCHVCCYRGTLLFFSHTRS